MLTRETHQCAVCTNMKDLAGQLKQRQKKSQGWNYDVLFVEYSSADDGKEYADLSIVKTIRSLEAMEDLGETSTSDNHKLLIVGIVNENCPADKEACLNAGMNSCIDKPICRQAVTDAMEWIYSREHDNISNEDDCRPTGSLPMVLMGSEPVLLPTSDGKTARSLRVLVVDDDYGQRTVLKTMLAKCGYQVDTAEDGVEAVRQVGRVAYDVVLMDGFMPNKTGWEATTQIRADELKSGGKKKLVIIGVTGATSKEDEEKCFASGMTDVISKPVKRETLHAKIEQWTSFGGVGTAEPEIKNAVVAKRSPSVEDKQAIVLTKEKMQQVLIKGGMKSAGVSCVFSNSSAACLQCVQDLGPARISIIILDTSMPNLDVVGTLDQIRKEVDGDASDLMPILAISSAEEAPKMKLMGFSEVIPKPVTAESIKTSVRLYLDDKREFLISHISINPSLSSHTRTKTYSFVSKCRIRRGAAKVLGLSGSCWRRRSARAHC
jgi:CheY-like chemotaxis protein